MLKYALLGFLNLQPYTGYDLSAHMEVSTAHFWHAKLSQIYTTLKKLEQEGLVESEIEEQDDRPDKRIYTITPAGRDDLQAWLAQPMTDMDQTKLKLLLKVFFAGMGDRESVLTELRLQKSLHEKQLTLYRTATPQIIDEVTQEVADGEVHGFYWEATRRFGEAYEQMVVDWLAETITGLEKMA